MQRECRSDLWEQVQSVRGHFRVCPALVFIACKRAGRQLSFHEIGDAIGLRYDYQYPYGPRSWPLWLHCADLATREAVNWLRGEHLLVKLPHEGARNTASYAVCSGPAEAARLQLAATKAALRKKHMSATRRLALTQALDGLRRQADAR